MFQYNKGWGSQFWKGLLNIRNWLLLGSEWKLGNGTHVNFWSDVWLFDCPLRVKYPNIYRICNQQEYVVARVIQNWPSCFSFRRSFGNVEVEEWESLKSDLDGVELSQEPDRLLWALAANKKYTTKSLYRALSFRGVSQVNNEMWLAPCPVKIKHFLWLALKDRIQSAEQLKKKGWDGSEFCQLCGEVETTNHILFNCDMARLAWCICRDALGWSSIPRNFDEFFLLCNCCADDVSSNLLMSLLAAVCWNLWLTRNNMVFRNKLLYSPLTLPFQIISNLLQWRKLFRPDEEHKLEALAVKLKMVIADLRQPRAGVG